MTQLHGYSLFTDPTNLPAKILGNLGEKSIMRDLRKYGLKVTKPRTQKAGDLWITDPASGLKLKLEVKTSMRGTDGSFQFCLYRQIKGGRLCTDCKYADFVVALAVDDDMSYTTLVIPASILTQKTLKMRDPLTSKFAQYVNGKVV